MSLSIVKRPQDFYLELTSVEANYIGSISGGGDLTINQIGHGLSNGNYVYITEGPSQALGLWYVEIDSANAFFIREYATASRVQSYIAGGTVTYYKANLSSPIYLSVHNPIVYKLQSTLWPVNGADTARSVSSFSSSNGYTALNLSGDIKATGNAATLEKVIIDGTSSLDGVYTIIRWLNDSSIIIDLPYSASNSFSGGTVQYYYYNYHAVIRVYSGLSGTFVNKPVELIATLKCVPNPTGLITVNINEILKQKISIISNDLAHEALPIFPDAYTEFYIDFAESYDDSNMYTVSEFVDSFTSDSGNTIYATNGKLPFKNRNFGFARYININSGTYLAKWMTSFTEPVLTPDKHFDIGIINTQGYGTLRKQIYVDDALVDVYSESINSGGVLRLSIEQSDWTEDRIDLTIVNSSTGEATSETITVRVDNDCSDHDFYLSWLNKFGVFDYWNFKARKGYGVEVIGSRVEVKNIFPNWPASGGEFADTIRRQTFRESRESVNVQSQYLTLAELGAIKDIISSPLVQLVTSKYDRRTVIVSASSLQLYRDKDDLYTIAFSLSYTDDIPSQAL